MCEVKDCSERQVALNYMGKDVCSTHWNEHCDDKLNLKNQSVYKPIVEVD